MEKSVLWYVNHIFMEVMYNHKILANRHLLNNHYINVLNWASMGKIRALALRNTCTLHLKNVGSVFFWKGLGYLKSNSSQVLPLQSDSQSFYIYQENN